MMDITLAGAAEAIQTALQVLQDVLTEETLAFFAEPYTATTEKAGRRILQIGPLLYSQPPDVLLICLWEPLGAIHPEAARNAERLRALVRPDVLEVVEAVTQETTWDRLESLIHGYLRQVREEPYLVM